MTALILTLLATSTAAAIFVGLIIYLAPKRSTLTQRPGRLLHAGKDTAFIQCGGCTIVAFTTLPGSVSAARAFMHQHLLENPDHGTPIETIPEGWDR